jgi:hypothetical protein
MPIGHRTVSYILIGTDEHGCVYGYIENSFSMGISSSQVRVWRAYPNGSDTFKSMQRSMVVPWLAKERDSLNKQYADLDKKITWKLYRVGSKHCPVRLNWKKFHADGGNKASKSNWRNLEFLSKT